MIPGQREPLFSDEERRGLVHAMASSWVAEALFKDCPRDDVFLALFDRAVRAELRRCVTIEE